MQIFIISFDKKTSMKRGLVLVCLLLMLPLSYAAAPYDRNLGWHRLQQIMSNESLETYKSLDEDLNSVVDRADRADSVGNLDGDASLGDGTTNAVLKIKGATTLWSAIDFYSGSSAMWGMGRNAASGDPSDDNDFYIDRSGVRRAFTIDKDTLNVGIDTSNPTQKLQVNGNILSSGDVIGNRFCVGSSSNCMPSVSNGNLDVKGQIAVGTLPANQPAASNIGNVLSYSRWNVRDSSGGASSRVINVFLRSEDEVGSPAQTMFYASYRGFYGQPNINYDSRVHYHDSSMYHYRAFSEVENKDTFWVKPSGGRIENTKSDMYVSGKVGIGTPSPQNSLHVVGDNIRFDLPYSSIYTTTRTGGWGSTNVIHLGNYLKLDSSGPDGGNSLIFRTTVHGYHFAPSDNPVYPGSFNIADASGYSRFNVDQTSGGNVHIIPNGGSGGQLCYKGECINSFSSLSDIRLKKDIAPISNALVELGKLEGISFRWKEDDGKTHLGFIAQDVQKIYPQLVKNLSDGYYVVEYEGLIPPLVEAVNELNQKLQKQEEIIKIQQKRIEHLEIGSKSS